MSPRQTRRGSSRAHVDSSSDQLRLAAISNECPRSSVRHGSATPRDQLNSEQTDSTTPLEPRQTKGGPAPLENRSRSKPRGQQANERVALQAPLIIHVRIAPAQPTTVYDTYWRFAAERQAIFFRRFSGLPAPWTSDPILQRYKFTNAYRASDRVSQYLVRHVIYRGDTTPQETFFRVLLFKIFNRIETWERLVAAFGEVRYDTYRFRDYDQVLSSAIEGGQRIYSAAYIMPSGGRSSGESRKHRMHLRLVERMMTDHLPERIFTMKRMCDAFDLLRSYPTIGDFLAYQYVTDLNYSTLTDFSESEFVVPGPGARDGLRKCFRQLGGLSEAEMIRLVADRQEEEFERLGLHFPSLWGRRLQYIDCQNLFCEVDKYARVFHPGVDSVTGRIRIKHQFQQSTRPIAYWYPPKWGINDNVAHDAAKVCHTHAHRDSPKTAKESADLWGAPAGAKERSCSQ